MTEQTQPTGPAPVNPNAPESLDNLAGIAAGLDGGGETADGQGAPVPQDIPAATEQDVTDLLIMAREMAAPAAEGAGILKPGQILKIWTDEVLRRIARPMVQIMNRHNLGVGEAFEKWGPYIMLLAGVVGPGFATYRAIQENQAQQAAAQADASQQQQQQ